MTSRTVLSKKLLGLSAVFMLTAVSGAEAHVGAGAVSGTLAGFVHPIGGLDHVLAMIAVGVLAAQQGARSLWLVPLTFVAMMLVGGALGFAGIAVPFVEQGIVGSIIILGLAVAWGRALSAPLAMAMVGIFAVFHGHAHGTEMPIDVSGALYALGFASATAVLHLAGIGSAFSLQKCATQVAAVLVRTSGGAIATLGMMMLAGA